jgi:hypothetical protein
MKKLPSNDYIEVREFIETLNEIAKENKNKDYSKLTIKEAVFLTDLLLNRKSKDLILFSIADYLAENYHKGVSTFANGASYRRLMFYKNFLAHNGNATKATISAGYSPKSAKQQGHRLLRWIQKAQQSPSVSVSGFS